MKSFIVVLLALAVSTQTVAQGASKQDQTILREILALHEQQLSAAEKDLTQAQETLKQAQKNKTVRKAVGIILTGAGIAGLAVSVRLTVGSRAIVAEGLALPLAGSTALLVGGGTLYLVPETEVPKWEQTVALRLDLVKQAKERVAELKAKLDQ